MILFFDMPQGSPEWFAARLGLVTASEFHKVLAKGDGKVRRHYMTQLAGERLTGELADTYTNRHMARGRALEEEARETYAFVHDATPEIIGFVKNGDVGCSPDGFLADDGVLEIKTRLPALIVEAVLRDDTPPEFKAQVQGALWVCERAFADLVIYWPGLPLVVRRVYRDHAYITTLAEEVDRFNGQLAEMVERVRNYRPARAILREQLERSAGL